MFNYFFNYFLIFEQNYYFQRDGLFKEIKESVYENDLIEKKKETLSFFRRRINGGFAVIGHCYETVFNAQSKDNNKEFWLYGIDIEED